MHRIYIKKSYCLHELFTPSAVFSNFPLFFPPSLRPLSFGWRAAPLPPTHLSRSGFSPRKSDSKFCREDGRVAADSPHPPCPAVCLCLGRWDGRSLEGWWQGGGAVAGWRAGVAGCLWPSGRFKSIKAESPLSSSLLLGGTGTFGFINRER